MKSLTEDDIKGATPYQKVGMFGILYDKSRIEHDQSTSNISYLDHTQEYNETSKRRRELEDQLGLNDGESPDNL